MDTLRITIKVETWTGPSATKAEVARSMETSNEEPLPPEYAKDVLDAMLDRFAMAVTLAGGDVREVPPDPAENPPR